MLNGLLFLKSFTEKMWPKLQFKTMRMDLNYD